MSQQPPHPAASLPRTQCSSAAAWAHGSMAQRLAPERLSGRGGASRARPLAHECHGPAMTLAAPTRLHEAPPPLQLCTGIWTATASGGETPQRLAACRSGRAGGAAGRQPVGWPGFWLPQAAQQVPGEANALAAEPAGPGAAAPPPAPARSPATLTLGQACQAHSQPARALARSPMGFLSWAIVTAPDQPLARVSEGLCWPASDPGLLCSSGGFGRPDQWLSKGRGQSRLPMCLLRCSRDCLCAEPREREEQPLLARQGGSASSCANGSSALVHGCTGGVLRSQRKFSRAQQEEPTT